MTTGVPVEILLFQREGRLSCLEFVVYSDRLKRRPNAAEIKMGSTDEIVQQLLDRNGQDSSEL